MQELVREYLGELKGKQKKRRRVGMIVAAFAVIIVGGVIWGLIQSGIAMTGDARCGVEEHTHSGECYTAALVCGQEESAGHQHTEECYQSESILICGQEESEEHIHTEECYMTTENLVCGQEESSGHSHTDGCYQDQLTCGREEHIHNDSCYIDTTADVEEISVWDAKYQDIEWKDAWGEDLVTAAKVQVGYKESTKNYIVAEDGSHKGYTRYGHFAGEEYADWDAAFVNFCMHYAGLETSNLFPSERVTSEWYDRFIQANETNQNYVVAPEGYKPEAGDLIFFNKENEETGFQMGVVSSYNKEKNEIEVIEGNSGNEVKENKYDANDSHIHSYLKITELEKVYKNIGEEAVSTEENVAGEDSQDAQETEEERQIFTTEDNDWAYDESYDADKVVIHVRAKEGVVPEGAELSVTPIEQKEVTDDMTDEEAAEAEKVNEQYEFTNQKLQEESEKNKEVLGGFLAYDICFIVDGEEVEPSGDVKVTMDFKEATKPEGVTEDAVVAVKHLKEDENAADGIVVEDLTEKEATTIATVAEDVAVEKVEVVAESFSTFVISWIDIGDYYQFDIPVESVDENGNQIDNMQTSAMIPISGITDLRGKDVMGQNNIFNQTIEGEPSYELVDIKLVKDNDLTTAYSVTKIKVSNTEIVFYDNQDNPHTYNRMSGEEAGLKIRLIYSEVGGGLKIKDDLKANGLIIADGGASIIAQYPNNTAQYVWYKSVNDGGFQEVHSVNYGDGLTTISADGTELNVALNGGGLTSSQKKVEYKVILQIKNIQGDIIQSVESGIFSVPYYSEVQNGSFEELTPEAEEEKAVEDLKQCFPSMEQVPGWSTTADGGQIEIVQSTNGVLEEYYGDHFFADHGKRFAEINAHSDGALYQDVMTLKDRPLTYYFSHRGRYNSYTRGKDQMYVVIVPTEIAINGVNGSGEIDTYEEVVQLMNTSEEYKAMNGVYVKLYTANWDVWTRNHDIYIPKASMTRFFFVSAQPDRKSYGNYIDRVSFNQSIPEPTKDTFNLRIEKNVKGLEVEGSTTEEKLNNLKAQLKNLTFTVKITDSEGNDITNSVLKKEDIPLELPLKAEKLAWYADKEGSFTGYFDYLDNPIDGTYTVTVTENGADLGEEYTLEATSKTSVDNNTPVDGNSTTVGKEQSVNILYTNTYEEKNVEPAEMIDLNFTKVWEDFDNKYETRPSELAIRLVGKIQGEDGNPRELTSEEIVNLKTLSPDSTEALSNLSKNISVDDQWQCTWKKLPTHLDRSKTKEITWTVEETLSNSYYTAISKVEKNQETGVMEYFITNSLDAEEMRNWTMIKHSASSRTKLLEGAEFELRNAAPLSIGIVAKGVSNEQGVIEWTSEDTTKTWEQLKETLNGDYIISETKAPEGYVKNENGWKVTFVNGIPNVNPQTNIEISGDAATALVVYIGNTALYALPDSGGSGIYWYMFSGILLMAGAALITYKKRCREVLRS